MSSLAELRQQQLPLVEKEMAEFLKKHTTDKKLLDSMLYSIEAGGKRLRPLMVLAVVASFGKPITTGVLQVAASLEMIHTYSLIHDDLPAMDDDDLRRGKPTNHKQFDEGTAVLAGDGLLTEAFHLLSEAQLPAEEKVLLIQLLAKAAGAQGMVAGQSADLQGEDQALALPELAAIHRRKTGALITYACVSGGILAEQSEPVVEKLQTLAEHLGLAFQIRDDLLDVTATTEELGKETGHDAELAKSTYPKLLGVSGAEAALAEQLAQARQILTELTDYPDFEPALLTELVAAFQL